MFYLLNNCRQLINIEYVTCIETCDENGFFIKFWTKNGLFKEEFPSREVRDKQFASFAYDEELSDREANPEEM